MPKRVAKVAQAYAGRDIRVGQAFEVEVDHVGILLTLGHIEPIEGESGYVARDLNADVNYNTRDMTARPKRPYNRKAA